MDFDEKEKQSATNQVFNIQKFTGILGNVQNSQVALYDYSSGYNCSLTTKSPSRTGANLRTLWTN